MLDYNIFAIGSILIALTIYIIGYELLINWRFKRKIALLTPPVSKAKKVAAKPLLSAIVVTRWMPLPLWGRIKNIAHVSLKEKTRLRRAGIYSINLNTYYKVLKISSGLIVSIAVFILVSLLFPSPNSFYTLFTFPVTFIFGFILVDIFFEQKGNIRLEEANRFFSDFMQLIIISMSAGLSLEASLRRVSHQIKVQSLVLHQETEILLADLSLRGDRAVAFSKFGDRLHSEYFRNLAVIMQQIEKQGVSSVAAMKALAASQSQDRFSQIEAKVSRLGVLMTIPLIVFVFPLLFGVIIIPSVLL